MVNQVHKVYTTFDEKEIRRLYEESYLGIREIANRFDVSYASMIKKIQAMRERGLISFYRGSGGMSHRKQRGVVLLLKGFSKSYVARVLEVDNSTVRNWAREIGLGGNPSHRSKIKL